MVEIEVRPVVDGSVVGKELIKPRILEPGLYRRNDLSALIGMPVGEMVASILVDRNRAVLIEIGSACVVKYGTKEQIEIGNAVQILSPTGTSYEMNPSSGEYCCLILGRLADEVGVRVKIKD